MTNDFCDITANVHELHDERLVESALDAEIRPADRGLRERNARGANRVETVARIGWKNQPGRTRAFIKGDLSLRRRPAEHRVAAAMSAEANARTIVADRTAALRRDQRGVNRRVELRRRFGMILE